VKRKTSTNSRWEFFRELPPLPHPHPSMSAWATPIAPRGRLAPVSAASDVICRATDLPAVNFSYAQVSELSFAFFLDIEPGWTEHPSGRIPRHRRRS
jgi:hypothetical protein